MGMILDGASSADVWKYAEKEWGLRRRQTDRYLQKAHEEIKNVSKAQSENTRGWHIAQRIKMIRKLATLKGVNEIKRQAMILEVAKDMANLQGLYKNVLEISTPQELEEEVKRSKMLAEEILPTHYEEVSGESEFGD